MIVECPRCALRYDVAPQADRRRSRCRCGALLPRPKPTGPTPGTLSCPRCAAPVTSADTACPHCGGVLLGRLCPRCFAAVPDVAKHCPACGAEIQLAARASLTPEIECTLLCPRCRHRLTRSAAGERSVERCAECGGLWVDRQVFGHLVAQGERQAPALASESPFDPEPSAPTLARGAAQPFYLNCPECGQVMGRTNFAARSGVLIDRCPAHGLWFDRDELSRVLAFVRDGRKARADALEGTRRKKENREATAARTPFEAGSLHGLEGAVLAKVMDALARRFGGGPH